MSLCSPSSALTLVDMSFLPAGVKSGVLPVCAPVAGVSGKMKFVGVGFFCFFSSVNLKTEFIHFLRGGHAIQNVQLLIIHLLCKK